MSMTMYNIQNLPESQIPELTPPPSYTLIRHKDTYLKPSEKASRVIFYNVKFTPYEEQKIREFKQFIGEQGLTFPPWWDDALSLRMLYTTHMQVHKLKRNFVNYTEFYNNPNNFVIDGVFKEFSDKMLFFTAGRDHKFRPVLYLYPNKLAGCDFKEFEHFVNVYLSIIQKYVFRSYYIENWVMIIDVEKKGVVNFPWKAIKATIDATNLSFSSRLHRMFILNPSFFFNTSWNMIKGFIDPETVRKFAFLKKKDFGLLEEVIPKSQLLKEYGGDLERPLAAFPIRNTLPQDAVPLNTDEETRVNNMFIPNSYKELVEHKNTKIRSSKLLGDELEGVAMETRSLRAFTNESQLSREMTMISSYSLTRG